MASKRAALTTYIAAREEVIGLSDDLRYGSELERREASGLISAAHTALYLAEREAERLDVLRVGRALFR